MTTRFVVADGPVEIPVDVGLLSEAWQRAERMSNYRGSIRGPQGNLVGAVGEVVALRYLTGLDLPVSDDVVPEYDLLVGDAGRVDVKTKERTVPPRPHFECSVTEAAFRNQRLDWYLFVSLRSDRDCDANDPDRFRQAWVLGSISHERFGERARRVAREDRDESNGWVASKACRNIQVQYLDQPRIRRQP